MSKRLAVIPELCSGCRICELACAIEHFGVNNPKKSAIRVLITYPHPMVRMPIVCSQCKVPACADACPVEALKKTEDLVELDRELCISCLKNSTDSRDCQKATRGQGVLMCWASLEAERYGTCRRRS